MILKLIRASQFMKYRQLEITDLPANGMIGIFGDNESGKSTIGEAIAFALFGCSIRYHQKNLTSLIQWDAKECEVTISFVIGNKKTYTVIRHLDQKCEQNAVFIEGDEQSPNILALGQKAVNKAIMKVSGLTFEKFRHSFYLAQKEIDLYVKEHNNNTCSILQKLLGFNRFLETSEKMEIDKATLIKNKENLQNELVIFDSMLQNIKFSSTEEKKILQDIEEADSQKVKLESAMKINDEKTERSQFFVNTYKALSYGLDSIIKALHIQCYQEKLQILSSIFKMLQQKYSLLEHAIESSQNEQNKIKHEFCSFDTLQMNLENLQQDVEKYQITLHNRLTIPNQNEKTNNNLQQLLQVCHNSIQTYKHKILFFACFFILFLIIAIWSGSNLFFESALIQFLPNIVSNYAKFFYGIILAISSIGSLSFLIAILLTKKKIVQKQLQNKKLHQEIEVLQKESNICLSFDSKIFAHLQEQIAQIHDHHIQQSFLNIWNEYSLIFKQYATLNEYKNSLEHERVINEHKLQEQNSKKEKITSLLSLIQSTNYSIDKDAPLEIIDLKILEDWNLLEKTIYQLISTLHEHQMYMPATEEELEQYELDSLWQEYDNNRALFRDATGITSMGGGMGMLNRLKMAFKNKSGDALKQQIELEKSNFFNTITSLEELECQLESDKAKKNDLLNQYTELHIKTKELNLLYQQCMKELAEKKEILTKQKNHAQLIKETDHNILVLETSIQMLKETLASVEKRFAPGIAQMMSQLIPTLTNGRYQYVHVTDDLKITPYSTDKNGFVDFSELSGGTADQLFLALRLAFSQAIVSTEPKANSNQFLFFDEPITSFDENRAESFFQVVQTYNNDFVQIFAISPRSYTRDRFDVIIDTNENSNGQLIIHCKVKD